MAAAAQWSYDPQNEHGPDHWGQTCNTGDKQSPINIPNTGLEKSIMSSLEFKNYDVSAESMELVNNGHTIKLVFKQASAGPPLMSGGGLGSEYRLAQIHFHWGSKATQGSEHNINNVSYPMEMHLVHFQNKYEDLNKALLDQHQGTLAVLGVLFQISEEDNQQFEPIINGLQEASGTQISSFPFASLLPSDLDKFYRYNGSLTTPGCFEIVQWTVVKDTVSISENQLNKFRQVKQKDGAPIVDNFRDPQPIGKRRVLDVTAFRDEEAGNMAAEMFSVMSTIILPVLLQLTTNILS